MLNNSGQGTFLFEVFGTTLKGRDSQFDFAYILQKSVVCKKLHSGGWVACI